MANSVSDAPKPVIVGIHGLANKPDAQSLRRGWTDAIKEGLRLNHQVDPSELNFELVYWADIRHRAPIAEGANTEAYEVAQPPLKRYVRGAHDLLRAVASKYAGRWADIEKQLIGLGTKVENVIGVKFDDLDDYYDENDTVCQSMRSRLRDALQRQQGRRILLIAHSMGSIIAYDVLRQLESMSTVKVEHFVTIGSPLGLPIVAHKIREEFGETRTPKNVRRWTNFADPGDKVSLDCNLADEFKPINDVKVSDILVYNEYANHKGEKNNHKSYGYLRAPEVSDAVKDFLEK